MDEGFMVPTPTAADTFLNELPPGVTLLPEEWHGDTVRVVAEFAISQQAIKNAKFDVEGFIKAKFNNTLTAIRHRRDIKELRLPRRLCVTIDPGPKKTKIYFYFEYAKL